MLLYAVAVVLRLLRGKVRKQSVASCGRARLEGGAPGRTLSCDQRLCGSGVVVLLISCSRSARLRVHQLVRCPHRQPQCQAGARAGARAGAGGRGKKGPKSGPKSRSHKSGCHGVQHPVGRYKRQRYLKGSVFHIGDRPHQATWRRMPWLNMHTDMCPVALRTAATCLPRSKLHTPMLWLQFADRLVPVGAIISYLHCLTVEGSEVGCSACRG
eukprot:COSAG02_NODE_982_length_15475_cov_30.378674_4_plen_213_part_00